MLGIVLVLGGALAGLLEAREPPLGRILLLIGGIIAATAAMTRSGAGQFDFLPAAAGVIAAIVLLGAVAKRRETELREDPGVTRRRFLGWAGTAAAAGLLATIAGRAIAAPVRGAVEAVRTAIKLPARRDRAAGARGCRPRHRWHQPAHHHRTPASTASTLRCGYRS